VLWLILGGVNADIDKAARCLKIDKPSLSAIFRGQRQISRKTVADKQWRMVLAKNYPVGWKQYSKAFDQTVCEQPTRAGVSTREPKDTESFGHILWLILGGKETEIVESAPRLNITAKQLTAIIHSRRKIYQEILSDNYWREILAAYYPNTWQKFSTTFEQRVTALPSKSGFTASDQREDDGSFGYALWLIIGGKKTNLAKTAQHLGISLSALCELLHRKKCISQRELADKKWRKVFVTHCGENWRQHLSSFEERAGKLPKKEKTTRNFD
jgi:plasmid maintenance system antidote protein VapI